MLWSHVQHLRVLMFEYIPVVTYRQTHLETQVCNNIKNAGCPAYNIFHFLDSIPIVTDGEGCHGPLLPLVCISVVVV